MARLKSRDKFPPGEFQVLHPETGMREPFHGSFSECVSFELRFRKANPSVMQLNNWTLNGQELENYVDEYNALRCLAHGWTDFVELDGSLPELAITPLAEKKTLLGNVVDKARAIRAGAGTYAQMFGDKGLVEKPEAESRAAGCVKCPLNDTSSSLWSWFVEAAAAEITGIIEHLKGLKMETSLDDKLGVCKACSCPMRAKVWARLDHILKNIPKDDFAKLDVNCWIRASRP